MALIRLSAYVLLKLASISALDVRLSGLCKVILPDTCIVLCPSLPVTGIMKLLAGERLLADEVQPFWRFLFEYLNTTTHTYVYVDGRVWKGRKLHAYCMLME